MKQAQSATQAAKQMMNAPQEPSQELLDLQKKVAELEKGTACILLSQAALIQLVTRQIMWLVQC